MAHEGNVMVNIVVSAKTGRHLGTQGEKVGGLFFFWESVGDLESFTSKVFLQSLCIAIFTIIENAFKYSKHVCTDLY